jgi:DNA recombination-dependent growth factor C
MIIKQLSIYTTEDEVVFDLTLIKQHLHKELSDLQMQGIGFVTLFGEEELYHTNLVKDFEIFNVGITTRSAVNAGAVEREYTSRIEKLSKLDQAFDMTQVLNEVNDDLTRMSAQSYKEIIVLFDYVNKRFMIDASRKDAEDVMGIVHNLYTDARFEVMMHDTALMQKLLTSYVLRADVMPDPFVLSEYTELGSIASYGDKPKKTTITIKEQHSGSKEIKAHLINNKRVNKLEIDHDGVVYFKLDSTCFISAITFEEDLKYKASKELTEEESKIAHLSVAIPELVRIIDTINSELEK